MLETSTVPDYAALASELQSAEDSLKTKIEKLFGKIEMTDFSKEFLELMDVHDKIIYLHTELSKLNAVSK